MKTSKNNPSTGTTQKYSILKTKLYIPPVLPALVPRLRLSKRMNHGMESKLTLISASAGFGKTTLLSTWIHERKMPAAWFSIDNSDNDPVYFINYVIAALQTIEESIGKAARTMLQSPRKILIESVIAALINDLVLLSNDFILVLDDYHLVDNKEIHNGIVFLLEHMPQKMHLIIATRSDPPLPLARLRSQNQLTELRAHDLCFKAEEITRLFNDKLKLDLTINDIKLLELRTEGWITGLRLAALSLQDKEDRSEFIKLFQAENRYIVDYLGEEVLNHQPDNIQKFLLQTSILNTMSGELCKVLTGANNSQQILNNLEKANLFIFPLDNERHWFRYHRLFGDFLHKQLKSIDPNQEADLHRKASEWYEEHKLFNEAILHAISGKDYNRAIALIERSAESMMMQSQVSTLKNWLDSVPKPLLLAHPLLCIYYAIALVLTGHSLENAELWVQEVIESDKNGTSYGPVTAFRALIYAYQGKKQKSIELAKNALELLPEENLFFRSFIAGFLGINYLYSGDIDAARHTFEEAFAISQIVDNLTITVLSQCHLAELSIIQGKLKEAQDIYHRAIELAMDEHDNILPIAGIPKIGLGILSFEWNDLDSAASYFNEGIELIKNWGEVGSMNGYIGLARIKQIQRDFSGAQNMMEKAKQVATKFDAMEMDDLIVEANQARLWIAQGNLKSALKWIKERRLDISLDTDSINEKLSTLSFVEIFEYIAFARILIASKETENALRILQALLKKAETSGWIIFVIEILILRAVSLYLNKEMDQAVIEIKKVLSLSEPGGLIRVFLDEGQPISKILEKTIEEETYKYADEKLSFSKAYVKKLLMEFKISKPEKTTDSLVDPLSERELEILHLIEAGLSNQEISEKLFISLNTVKTHLKNINDKLNVHSRTQAVVRAKELRLL